MTFAGFGTNYEGVPRFCVELPRTDFEEVTAGCQQCQGAPFWKPSRLCFDLFWYSACRAPWTSSWIRWSPRYSEGRSAPRRRSGRTLHADSACHSCQCLPIHMFDNVECQTFFKCLTRKINLRFRLYRHWSLREGNHREFIFLEQGSAAKYVQAFSAKCTWTIAREPYSKSASKSASTF